MRKVFNGTIARPAIQCDDPRTGKRGTWLFTGDSHKDADAAVSPLFPDLYELSQWCRENHWKATGGAYVFQPMM